MDPLFSSILQLGLASDHVTVVASLKEKVRPTSFASNYKRHARTLQYQSSGRPFFISRLIPAAFYRSLD